MSSDPIGRPGESEYDPYYRGYIERVSDGALMKVLDSGLRESLRLISSSTEEEGERRYAPGKWSLKEVFGHVIDTERILAYRALAIARGERQSIPGFDQDAYVEEADFSVRTWSSLAAEYEHLRRSNISLFGTFDRDTWRREGVANDVGVSVRALAFIIAGHELHHLMIIRERYLA